MSETDRSFPENQTFRAAPPVEDDLYYQEGGGFGSRTQDAIEQARIEREQKQREAKREQQAAGELMNATSFLTGRIAGVEDRLAAIEDRLDSLAEHDEPQPVERRGLFRR
jgi:hypothetical protein